MATKQTTNIDQLIINSPFEEPAEHWKYHRDTRKWSREPGRRNAGYIVATETSKSFDDPGHFVPLPLVNQIRERVKAWREGGYPGITGITRRLLEHWYDAEQRDFRRFFFCQLEAVETQIWLTEAPAAERQGIEIPTDGGPFPRLCAKMATGSGKTIVMAMLIAWHVVNKAVNGQDARFSKHVFLVAPGLTVKERLAVLIPESEGNYYDEFNVVPGGLRQHLRQGKVKIENWHTLNWDSEEQIAKRKSADKRGALSDEAYVRNVLGELASARNLLVINDEAHHAWRMNPEIKVKGIDRSEVEEATKWIGGLDRIHRARGILNCYDLSATPFAPSGKKSSEEALFPWVVSDFGLNDAIESGLVKTPRVVVRDEGKLDRNFRSRFYHIYADDKVRDDLSRKGAQEHEPLPDLVMTGYHLLGKDWLDTRENWLKNGHPVPPVLISVVNGTETAARVKYAFDHGQIQIEELCDPGHTLHIDSKVLEKAEAQSEALELDLDNEEHDNEGPERKLTKREQAALLRQMVSTVGKRGKPGEQVRNVISVGMLSEGWDAQTVTHIMGLRAFSSQLLCEQVVGRGLRRTSYDLNAEGRFEPEYVNIFGVPFTFLPHEGGDDAPPKPTKQLTTVQVVAEKHEFEIYWPNVLRIDHVMRPELTLALAEVELLEISARDTPATAEMAPMLAGKPMLDQLSEINLRDWALKNRMQTFIFKVAKANFDQVKPNWKGSPEFLLAQIVRLVEQFLASDRIAIKPELFMQDPLRRRVLLTLNMNKIVRHMWDAIRFQNTETLELVLDEFQAIRSTGDMGTWYTSRPNDMPNKSHISHCVFDERWEAEAMHALDKAKGVEAWAKNDHLGFDVLYIFDGVVRKYRPDFLIRLTNGVTLILEVKGQRSQRSEAKRRYLEEWVAGVNADGRFGKWASDICDKPEELRDVIAKHAG